MKIIGLTGKIGSGKTTTLQIIKLLGYDVFDCDACSNQLIKSKKIKNQIKIKFKEKKDIFTSNQNIDTHLLGNYVFENKKKLADLEKILHPEIIEKKKLFIKKSFINKKKIIFIDIPLIFKDHSYKECDYILNMFVKYSIQKQRVLKRANMSERKFSLILKNQEYNKLKYNKYINFSINSGNGMYFVRKKLLKFIRYIKES